MSWEGLRCAEAGQEAAKDAIIRAIEEERVARGLSIMAVARGAGVNQGNLNRLLHGKWNQVTAWKASVYLGLPVDGEEPRPTRGGAGGPKGSKKPDRDARLLAALGKQGATQAAVGARFGVSTQRVSQILNREPRR